MSKVIGFAVTFAFLCSDISIANAAGGNGWVTCKDGMQMHGGGDCANHGGEVILINASTPVDATKAPTPNKTAATKKTKTQKTAAVDTKAKKKVSKGTTGPTGKCNDGAMVFSADRRTACSKHGGVHSWY
jgi:hypothetical protein